MKALTRLKHRCMHNTEVLGISSRAFILLTFLNPGGAQKTSTFIQSCAVIPGVSTPPPP